MQRLDREVLLGAYAPASQIVCITNRPSPSPRKNPPRSSPASRPGAPHAGAPMTPMLRLDREVLLGAYRIPSSTWVDTPALLPAVALEFNRANLDHIPIGTEKFSIFSIDSNFFLTFSFSKQIDLIKVCANCIAINLKRDCFVNGILEGCCCRENIYTRLFDRSYNYDPHNLLSVREIIFPEGFYMPYQ